MDLYLKGAAVLLPVLAGIAILEAVAIRWFRPGSAPIGEVLASLMVAAGQRLKAPLLQGLVLGVFFLAWRYRIATVPLDRWWGIALLFLTVEFLYYWEHRLSHSVRWLWATHAVHHTPTHLNLAAALRLGWTAEISGTFLFFLPAILAGFHPIGVLGMLLVNLTYQFWIHNEWMPWLGMLEGIINTPSGHRVHHASNPEYLDRNFGGVLLVFDRLFGTYTPERPDIAIRYGLAGGFQSANPFTVALHEWARLISDLRRARTVGEALAYSFGRPGWHPDRSSNADR